MAVTKKLTDGNRYLHYSNMPYVAFVHPLVAEKYRSLVPWDPSTKNNDVREIYRTLEESLLNAHPEEITEEIEIRLIRAESSRRPARFFGNIKAILGYDQVTNKHVILDLLPSEQENILEQIQKINEELVHNFKPKKVRTN